MAVIRPCYIIGIIEIFSDLLYFDNSIKVIETVFTTARY